MENRRSGRLPADVKPVAADRTAPGQGREARSLHRDGAGQPAAGAPARSSAAWLLVYPDTYEIGLPNQGLQILYEILNERDDAVAERAYAPWVDLERRDARGRASRSSRSTPTAPAGDFDVLAFNLSAELVYTNLLELPRPRRRPGAGRGTAAPSTRS